MYVLLVGGLFRRCRAGEEREKESGTPDDVRSGRGPLVSDTKGPGYLEGVEVCTKCVEVGSRKRVRKGRHK